jgi:hypothetical protein
VKVGKEGGLRRECDLLCVRVFVKPVATPGQLRAAVQHGAAREGVALCARMCAHVCVCVCVCACVRVCV